VDIISTGWAADACRGIAKGEAGAHGGYVSRTTNYELRTI